MKELYMEIQDYYNGQIPEDFTIGEYLHKKRLENEEWQKTTELAEIQRKESNRNDERLDENSNNSKKE